MNAIKPPDKIVMMEDHDKAYFAWKDAGVKDRTLVHIDAHIDFGWLPEKDLSEILEVNNENELDALFKKQPLWNPLNKNKEKMVHIGNFIFPAMREGIVKKFYWVVPDSSFKEKRCLKFLEQNIRNLLKVQKYVDKDLVRNKDFFYFSIFGKDIYVCSLDSLEVIDEPVFLDIDVDFMLTQFIVADLNPLRTPWIFPEQIMEKLSFKKINADILTISYSVNGGYTPIRYKYLGDQLRALYSGSLDERGKTIAQYKKKAIEFEKQKEYAGAFAAYEQAIKLDDKDASLYFNLCFLCLNQLPADFEKAKHFYAKAISLDKTYASQYNNPGMLYQQIGNLKKAKKEYCKWLKLDENNINILKGLGFIFLNWKKYRQAEVNFSRVLSLNASEAWAFLGKGIVFFRMNKIKDAEEALLRAKGILPDMPEIYWWLGKVSERMRLKGEAINYYKQAVLTGGEGPVAHFLLFRLYLQKGFFLRAFEELKRCFLILRNCC